MLEEQTGRRLAVIGFFADWGHVQPLIRIAAAAKAAGWTVRCFVPTRAKALIDQENLDAVYLSDLRDPEVMLRFRRLSAWPMFFRQFSDNAHANLGLTPQAYRSILDSLPLVADQLRAFAPDLILSDAHLFGAFAGQIAQALGCGLVLHNPSGALAASERPYVQRLGSDRLPSPAKRLVELAGHAFEFVFRRAYYLVHFKSWRSLRALKAETAAAFDRLFSVKSSPPAAPEITTAMAWVEQTFLDAPLTPDLSAAFAPLPAQDTGLDLALETWIAASPQPIIYVSYGSMISLPPRVHAGLVSQLAATGMRIIWSAPEEELAQLRPLVGSNPTFLLRSYVAQPQLLRRKEVVCFLSHAGANSALEALIGGVPMVCTPYFADQPYIAGVLERIGVARVVRRGGQGSAELGRAIEAMLQPEAQARSASVSARIAAAGGTAELLAFLGQRVRATDLAGQA